MKALATLALSVCLTLHALVSFGETEVISTAAPDFTRAELDQMLAPVALYPDTVLSHVLIAATYPLEVVQADRWAKANPNQQGQEAVAAVEDQDWDPSVKALVAFPQILQRMSQDLDWTQRVGDAFLADEAGVMDAIQGLRKKAQATGNLEKMEYVRTHEENKVIVIEPAVERVVYVPYYDTRVVYGNWWWNDYPPIYWHYPAQHVYIGGFYWGPRIYVGSSFFFSSFHWHNHRVVVVDHHHHGFHSGRSIVRYEGARHWRHNPSHRRGVVYRSEPVRRHYGSNRESYRNIHERREQYGSRRNDSNGKVYTSDRKNSDRKNVIRDNNAINRNLGMPVKTDSERVRERLSGGDTHRPERVNDRDAKTVRRLDSKTNDYRGQNRDGGTGSLARQRIERNTNADNKPVNERGSERIERTERSDSPSYTRETSRPVTTGKIANTERNPQTDRSVRNERSTRDLSERRDNFSRREDTLRRSDNRDYERSSRTTGGSRFESKDRVMRSNNGGNNGGNKFRGSTESRRRE